MTSEKGPIKPLTAEFINATILKVRLVLHLYIAQTLSD
ncbi:hypothetical protein EXM36_03540 [Clostridium botulinum]|uniref:Uncharacterized protein n=2 Tax=Clostridium TaxID=1485 RepID=A0A2P8M8N1_CLOBO|nr:hypothetical protein C7M79_08205 [Clostridium botulinum]MBW5459439.1 hypothetical protein [Clostridium sporogenes]NFK36063.1 hypothetical protein [Clostridium botulinum H04402 065]AVP62825.1 hypothetical protein C3B64_00555 [Clostridium botulinum]AVQ45725.1 hypothetical protein C7M60_07925 [Clostridium botulinum]